MIGSAPDLLRFFETIRGGGRPVLSEESAAQMMRNQNANLSGQCAGPGSRLGIRLWRLGARRSCCRWLASVPGHLAVGRRLRPLLVRRSGAQTHGRCADQHRARGLGWPVSHRASGCHLPRALGTAPVGRHGASWHCPGDAFRVDPRRRVVYKGGAMTASTNVPTTMTADEMVALSKRHTIFEWSAQGAVDPIPVARAKGVYFWTPEGKRFLDFNSQLMCVNIGHGDERVIRAIQEQAATLAYANPFMATEAAGAPRAPSSPRSRRATSTASSSPTAAPRRTRTRSRWRAGSPAATRSWRATARTTAAPAARSR